MVTKRLVARDDGDRAVGIGSDEMTLIVGDHLIRTDEARESLRADFAKFAEYYFACRTSSCTYEDECIDCGKLKEKCICLKQ